MKILKIVPITEDETFKRAWLLNQAAMLKTQAKQAEDEAYKILTDKIGPLAKLEMSDFAFMTGYGLKTHSIQLTEDNKFVVLVENYTL
jgi:hypothetical protein